ncbi:MAG: hypothetical protein LBU21_00515, partial [Treponema sp.]|nr:hypothetical protein [Treponema sp.]
WEIERALAEGKPRGAASRLPELRVELHALLDELAGSAGTLESAGPSPEEGPASEDQDAARAALAERLVPMLRSGNTGVLDMAGEVRRVFTDPGGELLAGQIEDFEFDEALRTLLEMKERAGKGIPGDG